ncbi:MAG: DNA-directed RNA polymerase subunit omega [Thermoflavifilum sp.]|nr:DNA-directed RNA polymerase subunit omega [Thermoflavifilum sp.]
MSKAKTSLVHHINPSIETRNVSDIKAKTGNIYESIAIIAKRANQINIALKEELHQKLEEFASHTDSLEEIHENKEQIEISRYYEKLPNPALQATQEFLEDKIYYRREEDQDLFS